MEEIDRMERFGPVIGIHVVVKMVLGNVRPCYRHAVYGYGQFAFPTSGAASFRALSGIFQCREDSVDDVSPEYNSFTAYPCKHEMDLECMLEFQGPLIHHLYLLTMMY